MGPTSLVSAATAGFQTILVETDELGSVERNAEFIAERLSHLAEHPRKVIVVSTSKGSPETALALSLLSPEAASRVAGWISVGGLLRGSVYVDKFLAGPLRWFASIALSIRRRPPSIIKNLSTEVRRPAFANLKIPEHLLTLQYVGVPLSGQVSDPIRKRYNTLRSRGPNDGLTLLSDQLIPGGIVVTDIGLDHYYRDAQIDLKTMALAYVVLDELHGRLLSATADGHSRNKRIDRLPKKGAFVE